MNQLINHSIKSLREFNTTAYTLKLSSKVKYLTHVFYPGRGGGGGHFH